MVKCKPCEENKCERKYSNRYVCQGNGCTCICQESGGITFWKTAGSILGGVAAVAGGVAVTVLSVGLAAPVGGAIIGAGSSLVTNPIGKLVTGECMSGGDLLADVGVGVTVGALSGGIGAGGSVLSKGASTIAKLGIRVGAGAASGVVGGAVSETARAIKGEDVSVKSFAKSMAVGAVCGTVGGASSHVASNVSKEVASGVGKAVTRVAVQTGTAAVTDAGMQLYETGEVDPKRLAVTLGSQLTVATTAECARNVTLKTNAYADKMNKILVEETMDKGSSENADQKKEAVQRLREANRLPTEVVEEQQKKVEQYNKLQSQIGELRNHKENILKMRNDPDLTPREKYHQEQQYLRENQLGKGLKNINQRITGLDKEAGQIRPDKIGKSNLHFLTGDRTGQVAMDIGNNENGERGTQRVIADVDPNSKRIWASDYIEDHDYDKAKRPGENQFHDPFKAKLKDLPANQFAHQKRDQEDDEKKDN